MHSLIRSRANIKTEETLDRVHDLAFVEIISYLSIDDAVALGKVLY